MSASNTLQFQRELAVVGLARKAHVPVDDVARLYGNELAKLEIGARITGYLPIFAIRRVRETLRLRSLEKSRAIAPAGAPT